MLERIREITEKLADRPGPLLPVLHAVQDAFGYVPEESVPAIASGLNLSRAEVHGVISFYHLIRTTPPGEKTVYICRAESCRAMGGEALEQHVQDRLGIGYHETTADGQISLDRNACVSAA